jgi:glyoxylase-like metal-dependent hydrolase (beta-lactamase superfamily II)
LWSLKIVLIKKIFEMKVIKLVAGPIENNVYVAYDDTGNCVVVDAPFDCYEPIDKIVKEKNLKITHILITHTHWDHIGGLAELQRNTNAKICVHKDDIFRLSQPTTNLGGMEIAIETVEPDIILTGDETIESGDMKFTVLHTPGHSPGAICFLANSDSVIFVGDTLFNMSIGRTDFPGGDYNTLINSIKTKLMTLPDNYEVHCGHNESTTIGFERANNPFLTKS